MKKENLTKSYPGGELISNPRKIIINSVIIKAPPEKIWPWLIQLGSGRAGLTYSATNSPGTLLIERVYKIFSKVPWPLMQPFAMAGHYIMETRMLTGIKRRVESND